MNDKNDDNLKEIFQEIKQYHIDNGADENYATELALIQVYQLKSSAKKLDHQLVSEIMNKLSNVIYQNNFDENKFEIIQSLYQTLETIIDIIENSKEHKIKDPILSHYLFIEDGKLKDKVSYIE